MSWCRELATAVLAFLAGGYFPVTTGLAVACLCLLLVAQVTLTERPFAGWSAPLAVMAGSRWRCSLVWTLLSGEWSDSPARALVESDRALLYLLMLVFVGLHARGPGRLSALLRWVALAIAAASAIALLTRLLPATFPTKAGVNNERLAVPADVLERDGDVLRARRDPRDALHGLRARAGGGAGRGRRGAARRRGDALLHVLARRDRGGDRRARSLYMILAHPRGLVAALPAAGHPAGGRAAPAPTAGAARRSYDYAGGRRAGAGALAARRRDRVRARRGRAALRWRCGSTAG